MKPVVLSTISDDLSPELLDSPAPLGDLLPGDGAWEVEIGFGKGRFLLRRAAEDPARRFLGLEMAARYFALARHRMRRRGLGNVVLARGEALYLLSTCLPVGFAHAVHVYFPDPWPKSRHQRRRLLDTGTVDLVLSLLRPGGELLFATDFLEYGERVAEVLGSHPALAVERLDGVWPEGPRTNYEAKYVAEGRPIVRLVARLSDAGASADRLLHPVGSPSVLAAYGGGEEE